MVPLGLSSSLSFPLGLLLPLALLHMAIQVLLGVEGQRADPAGEVGEHDVDGVDVVEHVALVFGGVLASLKGALQPNSRESHT